MALHGTWKHNNQRIWTVTHFEEKGQREIVQELGIDLSIIPNLSFAVFVPHMTSFTAYV
jgi:hypothetical protein